MAGSGAGSVRPGTINGGVGPPATVSCCCPIHLALLGLSLRPDSPTQPCIRAECLSGTASGRPCPLMSPHTAAFPSALQSFRAPGGECGWPGAGVCPGPQVPVCAGPFATWEGLNRWSIYRPGSQSPPPTQVTLPTRPPCFNIPPQAPSPF